MHGGVGELEAIALRGGVGDIEGMAQCVVGARDEACVLAEVPGDISCGIEAGDMYVAVVGHLPYVGGGEGDDLIGDVVEVAVEGEREVAESTRGGTLPGDADIVLVSSLGTQVFVAATVVVEVVEGGHAKGVLVHQAHEEVLVGKGT